MTLSSNVSSIAVGRSTLLSPVGGTGPFSWAVVAGGAGGTVTSGGLYVAPQKAGIDTVQVTDSLGAKATVQIAIQSALQAVCDILLKEMALAPDQVYLINQSIDTLKDQRLYIAVGVLTSKPYGNSSHELADGTVEQVVNMRTTVSFDIMSYGPDARDRKEEVAMALASVYAEQQQEANSFYIANLTGQFTNLSQGEGSRIPNRFNASTTIHHMVVKTKPAAYFDTFDGVQVTEEP